jgi:hypothetical protein
MKPRVLASWEDAGGLHCVDILAHGDGTFGYALCRRDPEDGHGWRHLGDRDAVRFDTQDAAETAARAAAPWAAA